ncbi:MAG: hypothetical protein MMC33_007049 [Icmadophila ericetorum]|nr:hypothetical protein [Icmadophila ericetorum]
MAPSTILNSSSSALFPEETSNLEYGLQTKPPAETHSLNPKRNAVSNRKTHRIPYQNDTPSAFSRNRAIAINCDTRSGYQAWGWNAVRDTNAPRGEESEGLELQKVGIAKGNSQVPLI